MSLRRLIKYVTGASPPEENAAVFDELQDMGSELHRTMQEMELISKRALSRHAYETCKVFPEELEPLATARRTQLRDEARRALLASRSLGREERVLETQRIIESVGGALPVYEEVMAELVRQHAANLALVGRMPDGLALLEQVLAQFRSRIGCFNRLYGLLLQEYGRFLHLAEQLEPSARALLEATDVLVLAEGPHARSTLVSLENLGQVLHATRSLDRALESYDRLCAWLEELSDVDETRDRLPQAWLSRASVRFDLGDLEGGRRDAERSLEAFRAAGAAKTRQVADALSVLARIHDEEGDVGSAETRYRESIALMDTPEFTNLTGTAWTHLQLARLLLREGRAELAWPHVQVARSVYEREGWDQKPLFAAVEDATARCLYAAGQIEQAVVHARRGLDVARSSMGERSQFSVAHASNLGVLLMEHGELAEATRLLEWALELLRERPTPHVEAEGMVQCNLALVAERAGDLAKARELLEASRDKVNEAHGPVVLGNLLRVLRALGSSGAQALAEARVHELPPTPLMAMPELRAA
ncbi:MAG: tetratricopeptide repeat protein [Myxococcales bacterium]|nr:tetratricopeptide repeat protein [Myxococcales bacterium]